LSYRPKGVTQKKRREHRSTPFGVKTLPNMVRLAHSAFQRHR